MRKPFFSHFFKNVFCFLQVLKKETGSKAKILLFMQRVLRRNGDKACEPFLKALVHPGSRQDELAKLIDPERAEQLIKERG